MSAPLEFAGASVGYAAPVVTGATLAVAAGEVVGLIGPNGAGKTTLLRAVTGGAKAFAGSVLVEGREARSLPRLELARVVGVLPQATPQAFAFTAREFVEMGRHARVSRFGGLSAADREVVDRAMALTDTAALAGSSVDTLSGGDLQRLTLAQALAQEPRVLLLDEPTSHLDLEHRLLVLDVVRDLADAGLAVLAVFHDLDMAARYADRLAFVHGGALGEAAAPADVLTAPEIRRVFGVASVIGADPVSGAVQVTPVLRERAHAPARNVSVVVVSGSGSGAFVMRRLALDGFALATGALAAGDTDHEVASALGASVVELAPYAAMSAADEAAVRDAVEGADVTVVCAGPVGTANVGNLRAAASARRLVLVGNMRDEDDFAHGEGVAAWSALAERGRACEDARSVTRCVEEAMER